MKKKILSILLTVQGIPAMAGSVTGGNEMERTGETRETREMPANPVHHCTKKNDGSDYTDWSYVYFGSYPQTEVTGAALTTAIIGANYDANGDAWVNGMKYRRASSSDANNTETFGDSEYRYFKWERIKWRVLENTGSTLFVVANQGLDCKCYNEVWTNITWEDCTLRAWLNGAFYNTAFSSEQGAIVQQTVVNVVEDSGGFYGEGGNDTQDNVYLLSMAEGKKPEYGFCENYWTYSASRRMQTSDYAYAMGAGSAYDPNCHWWMRSPGNGNQSAVAVIRDGKIENYGGVVSNNNVAVVPALHIDLSSDLWSIAEEESNTGGNHTNNNNVIESQNNKNTIEQGNAKYTITDTAKKDVEYTAPLSETLKTVTIPDSIKINNTTYTVTSIAAKAFKGNKTLTKVTIGKNIKTIGKQAFYNCKKLKKVTIKTTGLTAKTVGAKAFKGIAAKATIKVPAKKLSAYQKILKKKGITKKTQKIKK